MGGPFYGRLDLVGLQEEADKQEESRFMETEPLLVGDVVSVKGDYWVGVVVGKPSDCLVALRQRYTVQNEDGTVEFKFRRRRTYVRERLLFIDDPMPDGFANRRAAWRERGNRRKTVELTLLDSCGPQFGQKPN